MIIKALSFFQMVYNTELNILAISRCIQIF